jgi:hypothetical protein
MSNKMGRIVDANTQEAQDREIPGRTVVDADLRSEERVEEAPARSPDSAEAAVPEKIRDPKFFVENLDVPSFFADPDFNPESVDLSPSEKVRAMTDVDIAKLQLKLLEKEILRICAENVDQMRQEGDFVEYPRGQAPDPIERGVVTYGETTPSGGMRVFYFFPEAFESIYEKRRLQRMIGESTVRRLLAYVSKED